MGDGGRERGRAGDAPTVGVMMLDTRFPRHPRDVGQSLGLPFPVLHRRVARASVARIVHPGAPDPALLAPFARAGRELAVRGATLLTTRCGFLHPWQEALAERLPVPFVASALALLPALRRSLRAGAPVGVLTFDAAAFAGAGLDPTGTALVEGLAPGGHFRAVIERNLAADDPERLRAEVREAAARLAARGPGAVVLECANLAPWRAEVERACAVPVIDLVDAVLEAARARPSPAR